MSALARDLRIMATHNKDGSYTTQSNRMDMFDLFDRQLREMGYILAGARSLKPKHPQKLVERWQAEGLGVGTIKNRMAHLRYWAQKVNKASVIPRKNEELGIEDRKASTENRAQKLDMDKLAALPCERMQLATRLMAAFGLRMEEAIKFRPSIADKGNTLALKASWCKGGRARNVPVTFERQRALLNEIHETVGNGSLIPDDKSYIQQRKSLEHQSLKAGFSNLHGLRHNYAQARYFALTGWRCPKAGGMSSDKMDKLQKAADRAARLEISQELGHGRIEITQTYLG